MWHYLKKNGNIYIDFYREEYSGTIMRMERELFNARAAAGIIPLSLREYTLFFCLFSGDALAGYANVLLIQPSANIDRIGIRPDYRRMGLGEMLLYFLLGYLLNNKEIELVQLEVNSINKPAVCLYKKAGFAVSGLRKNYYADGQDAVLMDVNIKEHIESIDVEYKKWIKERA